MMVFWLIAALLVLAALFFLLPPLLKSRGKDLIARDELNVTIFKDQLAELEQDLSAGILTQEQYDIARHDLERNFVQDAGSEGNVAPSSADRLVGRITAVAIALLVPVVAVSLYSLLGSGERGLNPQQAAAEADMPTQNNAETLRDAVAKLQARVQEQPEDVESWVMLGRSHYFLQQYKEASGAFAQASKLLNDEDPDILADYADTLAMANERNMLGLPYQLLQKALSIKPGHEKSLWLAGVAAYQAQDLKSTLGYWEQLLLVFPRGSEEFMQMLDNVNEIRATLGLDVSGGMAGNGVENPAAIADEGNAMQASISGSVRLDDALLSQAAPTDTVFVFARAASGPRMPLAILRMQVQDLPMNFTLDDSMAMSPQMKLSSFEQVVVGARISKAGDAMPRSGDLEGSFGPLTVGDAGSVELVINRVVP